MVSFIWDQCKYDMIMHDSESGVPRCFSVFLVSAGKSK